MLAVGAKYARVKRTTRIVGSNELKEASCQWEMDDVIPIAEGLVATPTSRTNAGEYGAVSMQDDEQEL